MQAKPELKNIAINLRKQGYSYRDILKVIKVSKSSLTLWFKDIQLSKSVKAKLKKRAGNTYLIGAKAWKDQRIKKTKQIKSKAMLEIENISDKEMFLLGAMLYWGEGTKQSITNVSQGVEFVNSDPKMCRFFIKWITKIVGIDIDRLKFGVYINEAKKEQKEKYIDLWSHEIDIPKEKIKIYFTRDRHSNFKRTNRVNYKGQLRMKVGGSTDINRKIAGWIEGICVQSGVA